MKPASVELVLSVCIPIVREVWKIGVVPRINNVRRKKQKFLVKDVAEFAPAQHSRLDGREIAYRVSTPGVSLGLLCMSYGGHVCFVEAKARGTAGKGVFYLTGQLGGVIEQSAQIALTWVNNNAKALRLSLDAQRALFLDGFDIHIHIPPGALTKDGPSLGVTLVTSLVSLLSAKRVRADTAMTGEMTLGGVLGNVGGIKDKILGAYSNGIKRVILPEKNRKDVGEVGKDVPDDMEIIYASTMQDVLLNALEGELP